MKLVNLIKLAELKKELEIIISDEKSNGTYDSTVEMYMDCAHNDLLTLVENGVEEYENKWFIRFRGC